MTTDFACHDASCAPPPVGTGGSKGGPSRGVLSPTAEGRSRVPTGKFSDLAEISDSYFKFAYETEAGGLVSIVKEVNRHPSSITIRGEVRDQDGHRVGEFQRMLLKSEKDGVETLRVEHDWFRLDEPAQGRGIAQAINDKSLKMYQELGVDRITVHAALQVGPYAWARQGYRIQGENEINNESARKAWVEDRLKAVRQKTILVKAEHFEEAEVFKREVTNLLNASNKGADIQPIHVASLGQDNPNLHWNDPEFGPMWPGKAVLVEGGPGREPSSDRRTFYGVYYLEGREVPATVASAIKRQVRGVDT